ncbi:hypothetical protein [Salinigranum marinum]|uniref:hypothetical protein n=1 Tax=Salinigranum marinum TaxID=1515595 RepID=UPI002989A220|nr:hypothetical protein [Salinigranum marinum]
MDRRTFIGALSVAGTGEVVGCLGSSDSGGELRGEYTADPATAEFTYECEEADLFEDVFYLMGRASSLVFGNSAVEWHIDMEAGKDLKIGVYNVERASKAGVPSVQLIGPVGAVILDDSSLSSLYAVSTESAGRYVLRIRTREWIAREGWRVLVSWYDETGCTRFTGQE